MIAIRRPSTLLALTLFLFCIILSWRGYHSESSSKPVYNSQARQITDFSKYAAVPEDYGDETAALSKSDQGLLARLTVRSHREELLKRLYGLNGQKEWNRYINDHDDDALPPLTKFAQNYIYNHQNPKSCKDKEFVVLKHFADKNGLGTVVHGASYILNLALRHNRILIWDYKYAPGRNFVEQACTDGNGSTKHEKSLDCVFERITSCEPHHVTKANSIRVEAYWGPPASIKAHAGSIPQIFGIALKRIKPDITPDALKYWWRTQAAAYMMRINGPAMRRIKELRLNTTMHHGFIVNPTIESTSPVPVPVPFPLPAPVFSMHVRHGDKGIEMELLPLSTYLTTASAHCSLNPLTCQKTAFLSTEDASIFSEARSLPRTLPTLNPPTSSNSNWTFYHSDIPRINGGPEEQLSAFGNRTETTLGHLQQLLMAVECDTIVGTRGSGWNRLIDELRCVWVDCRKSFLEVGPEGDWVYYNY